MALPPVRKTWQFFHQTIAAAGSANASSQALALAWKNALKGAGSWNNRAGAALSGAPSGTWTIYASGNGVTAGHDNLDRWVTTTDLIAKTINPVSWFAAVDTELGLHMCACFGANLQIMRVQVSRIGFGVTYGGADGTTTDPPTATDAQDAIGVANWGGPATDLATALHVMIATDGTTVVWMMRNSTVVGVQYYARIQNPVVGLHPQMAVGRGFSSDGTVRQLSIDSFNDGVHWPKVWRTTGAALGSTTRFTSLIDQSANDFMFEALNVANGLDNSWMIFPIGIYAYAPAPVGFHGFFEDVFFSIDALTSGDAFDEDPVSTREFAHFDIFAVPWDGSLHSVNPNGAEPARTLRIGSYTQVFPEAAPDATPPTVTATPSGGEIDRFQTIRLDISDNLDSFSAIVVLAGFGGALPSEVVFVDAGARQGFCGRYSGQRSVLPDGTVRLDVIRRLGGWPGSPRLYVWPVDGDGNLG